MISPLAYLLFTAAMAAIMLGIIVYYYGSRRKDEVEQPKHRMLEDDEDHD